MKLSRPVLYGVAVVIFSSVSLSAAINPHMSMPPTHSSQRFPPPPHASNSGVSTPPVYVPNLSHAAGPLPDGILSWDATTKETNVMANAATANFVFHFTNISTNPIVIMNVRPSCGCTTTKLPHLPWTLAPGTNGQMEATVNLAGKSGTLYKMVTVYTDKGSKTLLLKITMRPFEMPQMSEAQRLRNQKIAAADRQMVFKGECATCHVQQGEGKYGELLYQTDCAICHESEHRATMVPDLHALKVATSYEFWRTWIAHGKPGTLMPAFSKVDGGPLSDMQIASLASYLSASIPSKVLEPSK